MDVQGPGLHSKNANKKTNMVLNTHHSRIAINHLGRLEISLASIRS